MLKKVSAHPHYTDLSRKSLNWWRLKLGQRYEKRDSSSCFTSTRNRCRLTSFSLKMKFFLIAQLERSQVGGPSQGTLDIGIHMLCGTREKSGLSEIMYSQHILNSNDFYWAKSRGKNLEKKRLFFNRYLRIHKCSFIHS